MDINDEKVVTENVKKLSSYDVLKYIKDLEKIRNVMKKSQGQDDDDKKKIINTLDADEYQSVIKIIGRLKNTSNRKIEQIIDEECKKSFDCYKVMSRTMSDEYGIQQIDKVLDILEKKKSNKLAESEINPMNLFFGSPDPKKDFGKLPFMPIHQKQDEVKYQQKDNNPFQGLLGNQGYQNNQGAQYQGQPQVQQAQAQAMKEKYDTLLPKLMSSSFNNKFILTASNYSDDSNSLYHILSEVLSYYKKDEFKSYVENYSDVNKEYVNYFNSNMNKIKYLRSIVRKIILEDNTQSNIIEHMANIIGSGNLGLSLESLNNFEKFATGVEESLIKFYVEKKHVKLEDFSLYKLFQHPPEDLLNNRKEFVKIPYMSREQFELFIKTYDIKVNNYVPNKKFKEHIGEFIMNNKYEPGVFDLYIYSYTFGIKFFIFSSNDEMFCVDNTFSGHVINVFLYVDNDTHVYNLASLISLNTSLKFSITRPLSYYQKAKSNKYYIEGLQFVENVICDSNNFF